MAFRSFTANAGSPSISLVPGLLAKNAKSRPNSPADPTRLFFTEELGELLLHISMGFARIFLGFEEIARQIRNDGFPELDEVRR
jgi:hypothetical protein